MQHDRQTNFNLEPRLPIVTWSRRDSVMVCYVCRRDTIWKMILIFVGALFVGELCHSGAVLRSPPTLLWCAAGIADKLKCLRDPAGAQLPIHYSAHLSVATQSWLLGRAGHTTATRRRSSPARSEARRHGNVTSTKRADTKIGESMCYSQYIRK
jgi:hypothetical protein